MLIHDTASTVCYRNFFRISLLRSVEYLTILSYVLFLNVSVGFHRFFSMQINILIMSITELGHYIRTFWSSYVGFRLAIYSSFFSFLVELLFRIFMAQKSFYWKINTCQRSLQQAQEAIWFQLKHRVTFYCIFFKFRMLEICGEINHFSDH